MKKLLSWILPLVFAFSVTTAHAYYASDIPYNHYNHSLFLFTFSGQGTLSGDDKSGYQLVLNNPNKMTQWSTDCDTHREGMISTSSFFNTWFTNHDTARTAIRIDNSNVMMANLKLISWNGSTAVFDVHPVDDCTITDTQGLTKIKVNGSNIKFPVDPTYVHDNPSCNHEDVYRCS